MQRTTISFKDMPYQRPDLETAKQELMRLTNALKEAKTYEEARAAFLEQDAIGRHFQTLGTLSSIRHSIDTRDEFYDKEAEFWSNAGPEMEEYSQAFMAALLNSPFRAQFAEEFHPILFTNMEIALRTFSPELIPDMQKENELSRNYEKLLASAQVPFEGKTYTLSQMTPFKSDPDDARRLTAWKADGQWYKDHQDELDRYYDELVKVRQKMAKALGYDNYLPLGYDRMGRNCYTPKDVNTFREAVVKYLVPIADSIYKEQAKRLGKAYPMSYADNALEFRSGNPRPFGSADDILNHGLTFYSELSPETKEFFETMMKYQLLDVLSTEGKEGGGYCTGIPDYNVPFIFANFNGTQGDVSVVTHEAGHAFAYWMNADRVPQEQCWPSMESCEVHSMSMEFFAWPWAEGFFKDDTRKFYYSHLADALKFIPYGTLVDHFQHVVYEHPEYTPAERHAAWKELSLKYMPWVKLDGEIPFYSEGEAWQRQHHIYGMPFYYIDYCLAQTVSLEFWAMMQEDQKNAWEHYMAYTKQGGTAPFTELLKNAGMASPFEEETLKTVASAAAKWLEAYDLTGIE